MFTVHIPFVNKEMGIRYANLYHMQPLIILNLIDLLHIKLGQTPHRKFIDTDIQAMI